MADQDPMRLPPNTTRTPPGTTPSVPPMRQWIDKRVSDLQEFQRAQQPQPAGPSNTERLRSARAAREEAATQANVSAAQQQSREGGAAEPFFRSADVNAKALSREQQTNAAIAMLKQREDKPLSAAEQEALQAYQLWDQAGAMRAAAGQRTVVQKRNPLYEERKAHNVQTGEAQSQILGGRVREYEAAMEHERNVEAFRSRVALEDEMVMAGMQAKEQVRQEAMDEQIQAAKESVRLVQEAAEKFQRTPAVDPNRYWASRTAGQKFGAVLLGVVQGAMGRDPIAHIRQAIATDIDAQKADLAQAGQQFAALGEAFQAQRGAYADIRAAVEDERTADLVYERARLDQAEREFQWWMQKGQVAQMTAGHQAFMGQIQQAKADLDLQLAQRSQANPKMFTRVVRNPNAKALNARADKLEDFALKTLGAVQTQRGEMEKERLKAGGGPSTADRAQDFEQRKFIVKETEPYLRELELVRQFKDQYGSNMPGVGAYGETGGAIAGATAGFMGGFIPGAIIGGIVGAKSGELTTEQRQARAKLERIMMLRVYRESGQNISPEEQRRAARSLLEAMTDEDVAAELDRREAELVGTIDRLERAPEEREVENVRNTEVMPRRSIHVQDVPDPTAIDE